MTPDSIYPLFLKSQCNPLNMIEVFDCYDSRYGNIFYKGQLVATFYKQLYEEVLGKNSFVKTLKKQGCDVNKAQVVVYSLDTLRDYQHSMTTMDFELAIDYDYTQLLQSFVADWAPIQAAVQDAEKQSAYYQFIKLQALNSFT